MVPISWVLLAVFHWSNSCTAEVSPLTHLHSEVEILKEVKNAKIFYSNQSRFSAALQLIDNARSWVIKGNRIPAFPNNSLTKECAEATFQFAIDAIEKKPYTQLVIDSYGRPQSGIFRGNIRWNGRYYQCINSQYALFKGKWCQLNIGERIPVLNEATSIGLAVGICIPAACSKDALVHYLLPQAEISGIHLNVECPAMSTEWTKMDAISLTLFCIVAGLVLIGTSLEWFKARHKSDDLSLSYGDGLYFASLRPKPGWLRIMSSFSIINNSKTLFNTNRQPNIIHAIHGVRFLSIAWIILGHSFIMPLLYVDNFIDAANWYTGSILSQIISGAVFAVDTFFFVGGLLVVHIGMNAAEDNCKPLSIVKNYFMRFLRLTPPYAAIILTIVGFLGKLGSGPMWPNAVKGVKTACQKYWWTNLLYINNLYPASSQSQCYVVGWYLANDFQFYLLAPFVIALFRRKSRVGIFVISLGIFLNMLVSGLFSERGQDVPMAVEISKMIWDIRSFNGSWNSKGAHNIANTSSLNEPSFFTDLYVKPWCRIGPYLVGMTTAYILHKTDRAVRMTKLFVAGCWSLALGLTSAVVFGLWPYIGYNMAMPNDLAAFYTSVSRIVWAMSLSWITIACATGNAGPVNAFLSWKVFIPLSRLTYCTYLVHPLVILWWHATQEDTVYYSNNQFGFYFIATLGMSLSAGYVLSMLFEAPVIKLTKLFRKNDPVIGTPFFNEDEVEETASNKSGSQGHSSVEWPSKDKIGDTHDANQDAESETRS